MAVGSYNVDLTDATLAESTTGFSDINIAGGGGGGALSLEVDFAIQGSFAINRAISGTRTRGVFYDLGSATALGADDHVFVWTLCATPGISQTKAAGGVIVMIASANNNNYNQYYVNGSDTLPQGGMQNYAIHSSSAASTTGGTGLSGNPRYFGAAAGITATAKGDNFACDAIRYGTGYYIVDGEVANPIIFTEAAADNDLNANRYGVFTEVPGGFALKGRFVVGQTTARTPTQAYMEDSNTAIAFTDTEFSLSDFTQVIFDHPSTIAKLTNISFTAVGTNNPGQFNVLDSSTTGYFTSLVFNSIGTTKLNASAQVTGSTWNTCDTIFQSGSTIITSTFNDTSNTESTIISDDPSLISNNTFLGDGTKFGITVDTAGEYNFTGNTFTGFVSGSDPGAELLFDPPSGTGNLVLNILGGGDSVNFINRSSGTVTINNNIQTTLTGMKDFTEIRVLDVSDPNAPIELAGIENVVSASVGANDNSFAFSLAAAIEVDIAIISVDFENQRITDFIVPSSDTEIPIQQSIDRNYSNP